MYISIQNNIYCENCRICGARPVIEQLPKAKFKLVCPNDKDHFKLTFSFIDESIKAWNKLNERPMGLRKVS